MSWRLALREAALYDLESARDHYERERRGLGDEFLSAAEDLLQRISDQPKLFAVALRGVRRAKVVRFPYVVYYRLLSDRIEVIGVVHGHRDPDVWLRRT